MKKFIKSLLLVAMLMISVNTTNAQRVNSEVGQVDVLTDNGSTTVAYAWAMYYGNDQACYEHYGVTWSQLNGMITFMYILGTTNGDWFMQQSVYSVPPSL